MKIPSKVLEAFHIEARDSSVLHMGENLSWKVSGKDVQFVLKRLRNDRPLFFSGKGEITWLKSLRSEVPCVVPLDVAEPFIEYDGFSYIAYQFVDGNEPDWNKLEIYKDAGKLLFKLHSFGTEKYKENILDSEWPGYKRPTYNFEYAVKQSVESAIGSGLLDGVAQKELFRVEKLLEGKFPKDLTFIHGDYHLGNLIEKENHLTIIDFDECGFGSSLYDLGTMRLHTMAEKKQDMWNAFLEGYGLPNDLEDLKYGIASRFIFMIGKIPKRLDVPGLSENAGSIMNKYVEWLGRII